MPPDRHLDNELARECARLEALDQQRAVTSARIEELRRALAATTAAAGADATSSDAPNNSGGSPAALGVAAPILVPRTNAAKIALFRTLFRGRPDVFPRLWVNPRKGTHGYAPACRNEWVRGVCDKPRVKCSACPNQRFVPVDDDVIADHLRGRHVIGVYPLLQDDTCWLLAADFDGEAWRDDVAAFARTCRASGAECAVERSRSGEGAHAWFFFAEAVPAAMARRMGSTLLTRTMENRHQLGMQSYDRLFPSQDTLPRGGFGNLIALPLQRAAREKGDTLFLDDHMEPHPNQWEALASIRRMSLSEVDALGRSTERFTCAPTAEPVGEVRVTIGSRLLVEKAGLPSAMLSQIKRLAAFQNPEFFRRQNLRLSTARTPRMIACCEELDDTIALPRGCLAPLEELLAAQGARPAVADTRSQGTRVDLAFHGTLTASQEEAARAILEHDFGVVVAPPGSGKTVIGAWLIAQRHCSALVLVHRRPLMDQWAARLSMFLGVPIDEIGLIGGGRRRPNGRLDVAMIQSVARSRETDGTIATYGQVIVDECHHVPAVSFERVLSRATARYLVGLTSTPRRRDGLHPILTMQLGPVRHTLQPIVRGGVEGAPAAHRLVVHETAFQLGADASDATVPGGIQRLYQALAADGARNELILDHVIAAVAEGRSPIVLTERREHLRLLADRLRGFVRHMVVLQGGRARGGPAHALSQLAAVPPDDERLVLATGRFAGEGLDDARLDTLFLAMPISWKGTLVQYVGRLQRSHPGKHELRVVDFRDPGVAVLERMFQKRLRGYRAMGFALEGDANATSARTSRRRLVATSRSIS